MKLLNVCILLLIVGASFYLGIVYQRRHCEDWSHVCLSNLLAAEEHLHYRTEELRKLRKKCFAPPPQPEKKEAPSHEPDQTTL